jgi:hypothetical protein
MQKQAKKVLDMGGRGAEDGGMRKKLDQPQCGKGKELP